MSGILPIFLFLIVSTCNIAANARHSRFAECLTKPLLMPLLLISYLVLCPVRNPLIVAALLCGFVGDVFLLGGSSFLIPGLLAFLFGHLSYLAVFAGQISWNRVNPVFYLIVVVYLIYGVLISGKLLPSAGELRLPVVIYLICILSMSCTAFFRFSNGISLSVSLPFIGSLFFVFSDSLLALDLFEKPAKDRSALVMLTYLLAQALIVAGFILT